MPQTLAIRHVPFEDLGLIGPLLAARKHSVNYVEAPTAGSVILAAVLLKMGTYGFLRFCLPFFPDASLLFGPIVVALAVIGIVYGAWVSTVQPDMKKLVAYSSVSHLGFVMLGMAALNTPGRVTGTRMALMKRS